MQSQWMQQQQGPWQTLGGTPQGCGQPHVHHSHNGLQWQHNKTLALSFGRKAPTLPEVAVPANTPFSTDYLTGVSGPNGANYTQQSSLVCYAQQSYGGNQGSGAMFPKPPVWRQN